METYTISEEKYSDIITKLSESYPFETDGCLCGNFNYQLEENLYLDIYRSCRKSSNTPNGQQFEIVWVALLEKHESPTWEDCKDEDEEWHSYSSTSKKFELNEEQTNHLIKLAELITMKDTGYNKFGVEFDEEDYKFYTNLKEAYENIQEEDLIDYQTELVDIYECGVFKNGYALRFEPITDTRGRFIIVDKDGYAIKIYDEYV